MARPLCLCATLLLGVLAAFAQQALAGTFSHPVRLPEAREWHFAVNDRGTGVAIRPASGGVDISLVSSTGSLGATWLLAVPGGFEPREESVVLDDRNRIAVSMLYSDRTHIAEGEHDVGCCDHVALAAWHLGEVPPTAQVLAAPADHAIHLDGELTLPAVVIGPMSVTAVWTSGLLEFSEPGSTHLDVASAPFGQRLRARQLAWAPFGIPFFHLALLPGGAPVAS